MIDFDALEFYSNNSRSEHKLLEKYWLTSYRVTKWHHTESDCEAINDLIEDIEDGLCKVGDVIDEPWCAIEYLNYVQEACKSLAKLGIKVSLTDEVVTEFSL
jgi:hypothetical protein